jgi:ppGpp synthetase/RelA/SpoT-type nucleotidyltranferase
MMTILRMISKVTLLKKKLAKIKIEIQVLITTKNLHLKMNHRLEEKLIQVMKKIIKKFLNQKAKAITMTMKKMNTITKLVNLKP